MISSVLYGLQVYWTSIFILPKSVLKNISQKFNRFLWNGKDYDSTKAKVAWSDICFPKFKGGLGLKCVETWNNSSMMRHIWSLFAKLGSIWVAWIQMYLLKWRSFWNVKLPQDCSWTWRKLLRIQILLETFLSLKWEMDMVFIYGMSTSILVVLSLRVSVLELFMTLKVALMPRLLLF